MDNTKSNLILAIKPSLQFDCETEEEYVSKIANMLNELELKLANNAVIALSGYYGNPGIKNPVNAEWASILNATENSNLAIGELIIWKRHIEIPSNREDRINTICTPIFILCRKEEYRSYNLNTNLKSKKGNAQYHTPISNLIETNGSTIEEDYKQIEDKIIKLYNPQDGKVYRPFDEE